MTSRDIGRDPQPGDKIKVWPGRHMVVKARHEAPAHGGYVDYEYSDRPDVGQGMPLPQWQRMFPGGVYKLESDTPTYVVEQRIGEIRTKLKALKHPEQLQLAGDARVMKCADGSWWWDGAYYDSIEELLKDAFSGIYYEAKL